MDYRVTSAESVATATGKRYIKAKLTSVESGVTELVSIWSDYSFYGDVEVGNVVSGVITSNGKYKNLKDAGRAGGSFSGGGKVGMGVLMEKKATGIKEAQDNKQLGVKIAGAQRDAAMVVVELYRDLVMEKPFEERGAFIRSQIRIWRQWFMEEADEDKKEIPF